MESEKKREGGRLPSDRGPDTSRTAKGENVKAGNVLWTLKRLKKLRLGLKVGGRGGSQ